MESEGQVVPTARTLQQVVLVREARPNRRRRGGVIVAVLGVVLREQRVVELKDRPRLGVVHLLAVQEHEADGYEVRDPEGHEDLAVPERLTQSGAENDQGQQGEEQDKDDERSPHIFSGGTHK